MQISLWRWSWGGRNEFKLKGTIVALFLSPAGLEVAHEGRVSLADYFFFFFFRVGRFTVLHAEGDFAKAWTEWGFLSSFKINFTIRVGSHFNV